MFNKHNSILKNANTQKNAKQSANYGVNFALKESSELYS
jgi:hypothetical protein